MPEVENEQAFRQALIKKYGSSPPDPLSYQEIPSTGYALILSLDHTTTDKNNHAVYLGICPGVGWVTTHVEPDTYIAG